MGIHWTINRRSEIMSQINKDKLLNGLKESCKKTVEGANEGY